MGTAADVRSAPAATTALLDAAESLLYEVGYAGVTTPGSRRGGGRQARPCPLLLRFDGGAAHPDARAVRRPARGGSRSALRGPESDVRRQVASRSAVLGRGADLTLSEDSHRAVGDGLEHARAAAAAQRSPRSISGIFEHHFGRALRDYGLDENEFPLKVIVAAVTSFQLGLIVEGLSTVHEGHEELLAGSSGGSTISRRTPARVRPRARKASTAV